MTHARYFLSTATLAIALAASGAAQAAGTASGSTITNTAALNYTVGGVAQSQITASNSFIVDRKISLTVTGGATTTSVAPGASNQVTTFVVTNTSNATLDLSVAVAQQAGGTAAHGGTDNFDVTGTAIYVDTNGKRRL